MWRKLLLPSAVSLSIMEELALWGQGVPGSWDCRANIVRGIQWTFSFQFSESQIIYQSPDLPFSLKRLWCWTILTIKPTAFDLTVSPSTTGNEGLSGCLQRLSSSLCKHRPPTCPECLHRRTCHSAPPHRDVFQGPSGAITSN